MKEITEERNMDDAPIWYGAEEANAWASGWNSAIEELKRNRTRCTWCGQKTECLPWE